MRCVADWPTLNTKEDTSQDDKTKIEAERIFMEGLGVPANFAFIALGQDLGFKLAERLHPQSHPAYFLAQNPKLNTPEVAQSFLYTFDQKRSLEALKSMSHEEVMHALQAVKNPLHKNLFEKAKQHRFVETMKQIKPDFQMPLADMETLVRFFRGNNLKTNTYAMIGGMTLSTLFSGLVWQWLNDGLIRKHLVPPIVKTTKPLIFGTKTSMETSPTYSDSQTESLSRPLGHQILRKEYPTVSCFPHKGGACI